MKECKLCNKKLESNLENFYKNNRNLDGLHSYCKECSKTKSKKWAKDNPDRHLNDNREWEKKNKEKRRKYEINKYSKFKDRMKDRQRTWKENNKDAVKEYNKKRRESKKHKITIKEWEDCLNYFNNECAYCGLSLTKSLEKFGQTLNKEHVVYNGLNDLSNCVPSCKSCNSSKWKHSFEEWYCNTKEFYTLERYKKILKWLNEDYIIFIEDIKY